MKYTVEQAEKRIAAQYRAATAKGRFYNPGMHMKKYDALRELDMAQFHASWIRILQSIDRYPKD